MLTFSTFIQENATNVAKEVLKLQHAKNVCVFKVVDISKRKHQAHTEDK